MVETNPKFRDAVNAINSLALGATFLLTGTQLFAQVEHDTRSVTGPPLARAPWNRTKMPVGSYLPQPARDVRELRDQINNDPVVMERYKRVFYPKTPEQIRQYLNTLVLTKTEKDFATDVWYVHPDGVLGSRSRVVKKGTYVFSDPKNGKVVLAQVCGNPLRNVLDAPPLLNPAMNSSSIQEFLEDEPLPPKRTAVLNAAMFDMAAMRIAPPKITNLSIVRLQRPTLRSPFIGFSPVAPPLVPPTVPVTPAGLGGIPPVVPPVLPFGAAPPQLPEPGLITLAITSLGSGIVLRGGALRRRRRA